MRTLMLILCCCLSLVVATADASDPLETPQAPDPESRLPGSDAPSKSEEPGEHYDRWVGRPRAELIEFWGQPNKTKRKDRGDVLIYELRVTCDGMISGTVYNRLGKGVVTGSQDPLDGFENNVPQGATRRAGARVAAKQTVRFFLDTRRTVSRYEATETKTNWKRCKY